MTRDNQPMLPESVGCVSCAIVHSLRLDGPVVGDGEDDTAERTSNLFIARVLRIEKVHDGETRMPLVYFRKDYTTAQVDAGGES